jgi:catechol 2,3-dioxygenase-like lactoylglutathione lyase family enzyme
MSVATPVYPTLDLGWLVICLPAADFEAATDFYKKIGFIAVGGQPEHGWLVMGAGHCEINPMKGLDSVWINFRGADIAGLAEELKARGFSLRDHNTFDPEKWPKELWHGPDGQTLPPTGSGDFFIDDPDGNVLYFDTVPVERVRSAAGKLHSSPGFDGDWREGQPQLGSFELLIRVRHLAASREFYQKLGLGVIGTDNETILMGGKDGASGQTTRIRLRLSDTPGCVLRFVGADPKLEERFTAARLKPVRSESKLILNSPDGQRLKFLFSEPASDN